jgi:prevent-host-death family protein
MGKPIRDEVRIAELKARFSEYLRIVRRGREIVIKDRETPIARLTPIEPPNPVLGIVPATRSVAQVMKMLRSAQRQPLLQPGVLDKAIEENKRDVYDKWIGGELT